MNHFSQTKSRQAALMIWFVLLSFLNLWAQTKEEAQALPEMPAKVYDRIAPVVVKIIAENGIKVGSGSVIGFSPQGRALILTACHVVAKNFEGKVSDIALEFHQDLKVKIGLDSILVPAQVVPTRFDAANDLALIATRTLVLHNKVIRYNRSDGVKPGHLIAAAGFPDTDELTLSVGRITRLQENFLVSDSKVVPGNSGGPLIDKAGRMIGLSISTYEGEGYSLPMNLVLSVADNWVKSMKMEEIWALQKYTSFWDMLTAPQYLLPGLVVVTGGTYAAIRRSPEAPTFGNPPHPGDIGKEHQ